MSDYTPIQNRNEAMLADIKSIKKELKDLHNEIAYMRVILTTIREACTNDTINSTMQGLQKESLSDML